MSEASDTRPSFQQTRMKHNIALGHLLEDLVYAGVAEKLQISWDSLQLLDMVGVGRPEWLMRL